MTNISEAVKVTFLVSANVKDGENLYITGNASELGAWSFKKCLSMNKISEENNEK